VNVRILVTPIWAGRPVCGNFVIGKVALSTRQVFAASQQIVQFAGGLHAWSIGPSAMLDA
jgi:hypothetical protein